MLAGELYIADDPQLAAESLRAVVTRDLPADVVAVGNPARVIRSL
jgi:serine acetyltransferase